MRAEELKGHLDTLLLAALEDGPRHGYAVMDALRQSTGGRLDLPTGTIYPALHRLEQAGLIAGSWSVVAGRRRRLYQLTAAGAGASAPGCSTPAVRWWPIPPGSRTGSRRMCCRRRAGARRRASRISTSGSGG